MIALALSVVWLVGGLRLAVGVGRAIRLADSQQRKPEPEADFLWDQPTDVLSNAAVDARFAEITAHFSVRS